MNILDGTSPSIFASSEIEQVFFPESKLMEFRDGDDTKMNYG